MRNQRFLLLLPLSLLLGAFGLGTAACGSSSSSGGTGGAAGDCFDYSGFNGASPAVSFKTDVVPIFASSCALSTSCHGCDSTANPTCTAAGYTGYTPFLGPTMQATPTTAQLQSIHDSIVGAAAALQTSTLDSSSMVGNPDMSIVKASDPAHSFILYKLDGSFPMTPTDDEVNCATLTCAAGKSCGEAMPQGGPALAEASRDTIRRWIAQGALNN